LSASHQASSTALMKSDQDKETRRRGDKENARAVIGNCKLQIGPRVAEPIFNLQFSICNFQFLSRSLLVSLSPCLLVFLPIRRAARTALAALMLVVALTAPAHARAKLENICTLAGQSEQRLIGLGLVTGLKGTGDGGKYLPMINALGAALAALNNPASGPNELKDAGNVALVLIEATVPANGIRRGQRHNYFLT